MRRLKDGWFRLRALWQRGRFDHELDEEVAFHLEMAARKHVANGMDPEQAERRAAADFGHLEGHKRSARDSWGVSLVGDIWSDTRFAWRQLLRRPAFTLLAALTLGLGIGGTVALWSVAQGVLLRPLPYADEEKLAMFWAPGDWFGMEYDFARQRLRGFEHLAAFTDDVTTLRTADRTSVLGYVASSANIFDLLRATPLLGRTFDESDDRPGAEPVVVLSHELWQQDFGGDPQILGQRLDLGGTATTVIGVMPPRFYFPYPEFRAWMPLRLDPDSEDYWSNGYLQLIGRQLADWSEQQIEGDITALANALGEEYNYPDAWDKSKGAHIIALRDLVLGPIRPALLLLLSAVGLLLLMACANVAALLLTRTADRGQELAMRSALGAGRGRLTLQLLIESMLLGLLAATVGVALAYSIFELLIASLPLGRGFDTALGLDWTSLAMAFALALLTAMAISIMPIRSLQRRPANDHLASGPRQTGLGQRGTRAQKTLVLAEAMLAVTLVIGATLLARSVDHLRAVDPGFQSQGLLAVDLVAASEIMDSTQRQQFFDRVVERAAALPGVESAALTNRLALRDDGFQGPVEIEDRPDLAESRRPNSYYRTATPDYFRTLGIELLAGRTFEARDSASGPAVAMVSEGFAEQMWPGQSAVGKRVRTGVGNDNQLATVIGVAGEVRVTNLVANNPPVLYRPQAQRRTPGVGNTLLLATSLEPTSLVASVRAMAHRLDSRVAVAEVTTLQQVLNAKMAEPLRLRFFLGLFALLGVILGTVGIYGVVSYGVSRQRRELGVRMALGATPWEVWREVISKAVAPVALGTLCGIAVSLVLGRGLRAFLFQVEPHDPTSFALAASVLLGAGVFAALVPAWRASRVDPSLALRAE